MIKRNPHADECEESVKQINDCNQHVLFRLDISPIRSPKPFCFGTYAHIVHHLWNWWSLYLILLQCCIWIVHLHLIQTRKPTYPEPWVDTTVYVCKMSNGPSDSVLNVYTIYRSMHDIFLTYFISHTGVLKARSDQKHSDAWRLPNPTTRWWYALL